jgi:hypothetical protein
MRKWVLWGHHFSEYIDMFDISEPLPGQKILEFACGPTVVNQELSQKGVSVTSCDPWFETDVSHMREKFFKLFDEQVEKMKAHPKRYNLDKYGGMETFFAKRRQGIEQFLADYPQGLKEGRYQGIEGFHLPFKNASFDLAICSNYLFADIPEQGLDFQLAWIQELTRVAVDVRFYPLTDKKGEVSELLGPVLLSLQQQGYQVAIQEVPFRLLPASKAMLKVSSGRCQLDGK